MLKLKPFLKLLLICNLILVAILGILKAPEIHRVWLRTKVAEKVFEIRGRVNGSGGTGFALEAPSGQTYLVTNAHVCEHALKDGNSDNLLLVIRDGGMLKRQVLEISNKTDLCIIEGWPGIKGLKLGENTNIGNLVFAVGHPLLGSTTMTMGEVRSFEDVTVLRPIFNNKLFKGTPCNKAKNEAHMSPKFFETTRFGNSKECLVSEKKAIATSVSIYPGSSGSPLVDKSGKVVGVMFASNTYTHWGYAVNLNNLSYFLKNY